MAWNDDSEWLCGAFQAHPPREMKPYRCTQPYGHAGPHRADLDGEMLAEWPRNP
ncbi:hypothetical protein [Micromonospora zingiberis]|uniref:hypothetical protein n=1 Tax=Micromonospora zingiberis TaxID=2053011 RepID=UPI0013F3E200|nr:hypothetical protein [Micromonospora zingiberis]